MPEPDLTVPSSPPVSRGNPFESPFRRLLGPWCPKEKEMNLRNHFGCCRPTAHWVRRQGPNHQSAGHQRDSSKRRGGWERRFWAFIKGGLKLPVSCARGNYGSYLTQRSPMPGDVVVDAGPSRIKLHKFSVMLPPGPLVEKKWTGCSLGPTQDKSAGAFNDIMPSGSLQRHLLPIRRQRFQSCLSGHNHWVGEGWLEMRKKRFTPAVVARTC